MCFFADCLSIFASVRLYVYLFVLSVSTLSVTLLLWTEITLLYFFSTHFLLKISCDFKKKKNRQRLRVFCCCFIYLLTLLSYSLTYVTFWSLYEDFHSFLSFSVYLILRLIARCGAPTRTRA